jgi:hypothetical protein
MAEEPKTPQVRTETAAKAPTAPVGAKPAGAGKPSAKQASPQAPRPHGTPKYGNQPKKKSGSALLIPFVFVGFMAGLGSIVSAIVLYIYEIIQNNKKNEWPGWSGVDALNYLFFQDHPYFISGGTLYNVMKMKAIDFHVEPLTKAVNWFLVTYLDCSIVFLCLLNGIILITLSVRTALFRLNKEGG